MTQILHDLGVRQYEKGGAGICSCVLSLVINLVVQDFVHQPYYSIWEGGGGANLILGGGDSGPTLSLVALGFSGLQDIGGLQVSCFRGFGFLASWGVKAKG